MRVHTMRARKSGMRWFYRLGLVLLAIIILTPRFDWPALTELTAVFNAVEQDAPRAG